MLFISVHLASRQGGYGSSFVPKCSSVIYSKMLTFAREGAHCQVIRFLLP